ncbi:MAG: hypothetical protein KGL53_09120 [Elusimicrobia bacterium]|nr:hypothetical protein [Elusimicrobiota bacterium]
MRRAWRFAAVFVLGAAAGAGAMLLPRVLRPSPQRRFARMVDRFSSELKLRPDQKEKVEAVFEARRKRADELHAQFQSSFEALRSSTTADIRAVLDPDQQARFDALRARWEARRRRHPHPGPWR